VKSQSRGKDNSASLLSIAVNLGYLKCGLRYQNLCKESSHVIQRSIRFVGPCNSFYCLGHFKNVYDDDYDDGEVHMKYTYAAFALW